MKENQTLKIIVLAIVGFTAFGFIQNNTQEECKIIPNNQIVSKTKTPFLYHIGSDYSKSITQEKLKNVTKLSDLIEHYPSNWIKDYVSTSITENFNNKIAEGRNELLTSEQLEILKSLEINSDLNIKVLYHRENAVTHVIDTHQMAVSLTVVPTKEAKYINGYNALMTLVKKKTDELLAKANYTSFEAASIVFVINEDGKSINIMLDRTSGHKKLDEAMIHFIENMSLWIPAENASGEKVKQKFRFNYGAGGC